MDAVDEDGWGCVHSLGSGVLPHLSDSPLRVVLVAVPVQSLYRGLLNLEFSCHLLRPPGFKVCLGRAGHAKDSVLHAEGVVFVLVLQAAFGAIFGAQISEEGDKLANLPSMRVVWQWEWCVSDAELILDGAAKPFLGERLLPDWVFGEACGAHEVEEELDVDSCLSTSFYPSWVGSVDGSVVCGDASCDR